MARGGMADSPQIERQEKRMKNHLKRLVCNDQF